MLASNYKAGFKTAHQIFVKLVLLFGYYLFVKMLMCITLLYSCGVSQYFNP
jgi:hypothetical protein